MFGRKADNYMKNKAMDIPKLVELNGKYYFKPYRSRAGMYCYDCKNESFNIVEEPIEIIRDWEKYYYGTGSGTIGKYVVFAPYYGKEFVILNTENEEIIRYENTKRGVYISAVLYNDDLYIFSEKIADTVVFSKDKMIPEYPFSYLSRDMMIRPSGSEILRDGRLIVAAQTDDMLVCIDLISKKVSNIELDKIGVSYNIVVPIKNRYILAGNRPYLYQWDGKNIKNIGELDPKWMRGDKIPWPYMFSRYLRVGNKVYFSPENYQMFVAYNEESKEIEYIYEMEDKEIATISNTYMGIVLSVVENDDSKKNYLYTDKNEIEIFDRFDFRDDFRLRGQMREYSKNALVFFLEDIVAGVI